MMKNYLLVRCILCFALLSLFTIESSFAQQTITAKRIEISNPTYDQLLQIKNAGFDLACDAIFEGDNLILEVGQSELDKLDSRNINYSVLVEDLILHYKEKNERELPIARMQLEQMKAESLSQRSLSTQTESIDNFIQYEGCSEVDWAVPQQFNLGSMGGCLTYSEVLAELDEMRALYPNLISVKTDASPTNQVTHGNSFTNGGQYDTWPGQTVYYVRISDNPDTDEANEPESLYSGMTHSREVSSMMNLIYYMWYILENYDKDPGVKNLVDNHEMYFMPVANPDGLLWNEQIAPSGGGLQRKNLGPYNTGNNDDRGVDLNRNYDYFWGPSGIYGGSSGTQSDPTYRGPSAFSEPETQIVRDFSATRQFKTAMNHHATSNLIPHAYNGYPAAPASGREAEFAKFCEDMTRYNRYIYGEAPDILTIANGDMSDWMLGGVADVNGSTGSGQGIMALAPENGSWITADGEGGFWPNAAKIVEIAQRAVRMNFANVYHSGKFAQFHDLNNSDITTTSGNFEFGIEYLGQTLGDINLNVTPVSANITSISSPPTQTSWNKLEQRTVTAAYTLDAGIQPNDMIEFQITLSNDDGYVMYQANIIKYYNPTVLSVDNPDSTGISNWTSSGGTWGTTADAYSGTTAITDSPSGAYGNNINKTLTYNTALNLSTAAGYVVQYYAKWDLERNFDYVQIQGSTDGTNWTTLCGKYTKPGSSISTNRYSSGNSTNNDPGKTTADQNNQPTGVMLYDADTMDKWVMEEIFIDAENNNALLGASNVQFRFLFDSDSVNRADGYPTTFDGFIFDDFKVIELNKLAQTITIDAITDKLPSSPNFDVVASATSGLPVSLSILSGPATISGNTITLTGSLGTVIVEATQVGNTDYNEAPNVTASFEVRLLDQLISFEEIPDKFIIDPDFDAVVSATSGLPVTLSILSGPATISGNTISLTGATGTVVVQATQTGNTDYNAASSVNESFEVTEVVCVGDQVTAYPYSESFESGFGFWSQNTGDDIDWTRQSGVTPSNTTGPTGPSGASDGSFYLFTESSGNGNGFPNKLAILEGPCFDLTNKINSQLSFDYHMFGANMGTLTLEVSTDNGANYTTVFTISGQQHFADTDPWTNQVVDLSAYNEDVIKLRFTGTTGSSFTSDIAIDNLNFTADENTLSTENTDIMNLSIYPNPFDDAITIKYQSSSDLKVSIYDISGRLFSSKEYINTNEIQITDLNKLSAGTYFIKIQDNINGISQVKSIIKK